MSDTYAEILEYFAQDSLSEEAVRFSPEQQRILNRVNQKVAGAANLDEVMDFIFEATRELSPCDRLGIAFAEEQGERLVSRWNRAIYEPVCLNRGYHQDLQHSSLEQVIRSGRVRIINDLERYYEQHPGSVSTSLLLREGIRSSMTCPLLVDGRPAGVLFRSAREPGAYTRHHVLLHLATAERIGQAVEKAWRIEQLTEANRVYTEMLGFVSHELKSPLASLLTDAQLLTDGYLGKLDEKQRDKIVSMSRKAEYLMGLIKDYLDLARIENGQLEPEFQANIDYRGEIILPAIDIIQPQLEKKGMMLEVDMPEEVAELQADPQLLKIVLVNLLSNAVKYGREGGQIRITVTRQEGGVQTAVWNEGPGFSPEQKSRLFRRFSRLDSPELKKEKGTGIGLYTCWRIVQLHHGKIVADAEPGRWACFAFSIPQPVSG